MTSAILVTPGVAARLEVISGPFVRIGVNHSCGMSVAVLDKPATWTARLRVV